MKLESFTKILLFFLLPFCKSFSVNNPVSPNHQYGADIIERVTEFDDSGSGDHSGEEPSSTPVTTTTDPTTATELATTTLETTDPVSVCESDGDCNAPFGKCVLRNQTSYSCECMSTFSGTYCNNSLVFVIVIVVSFLAFTLLITLLYFCCGRQENNPSRTTTLNSSNSTADDISLKSFDSLEEHLKGVSFLPGMREKQKSVRLVKMNFSNDGFAVSSEM